MRDGGTIVYFDELFLMQDLLYLNKLPKYCNPKTQSEAFCPPTEKNDNSSMNVIEYSWNITEHYCESNIFLALIKLFVCILQI